MQEMIASTPEKNPAQAESDDAEMPEVGRDTINFRGFIDVLGSDRVEDRRHRARPARRRRGELEQQSDEHDGDDRSLAREGRQREGIRGE